MARAKKAVKKPVRKTAKKPIGKPESLKDGVFYQKGPDGNLIEVGRMEGPIEMKIEGPGFSGLMNMLQERPDLKKHNVMTEAQDIIYGDREQTYGAPDLNLESIAQLWTVYVQRKAVAQRTTMLNVDDVCQMMILLKTARLINNPSHHDSLVDQVGYAGLMERCQNECPY